MRAAFIKSLCALASSEERICLLTGDLGFLLMEEYRARFPQRFFNVGVAEQNMIGMAAGMAEAGMLPYAYSIAPFASLRPFEFIRNGPVMHGLPVRIVGMGMGFEYGHAGPTHYALEDVAALRTLPGLNIVIPADAEQAATALLQTAGQSGPIYYSLGRDDRVTIPGLHGRFELGRVQTIRDGKDLCFICMGTIASGVVDAANRLERDGIETTIAIVSNFSPDPVDDVADLLRKVPYVVTVEAQTLSGGLGAFVASVIATRRLDCRQWMLGVTTPPDGTSGSAKDRWRKHGLDPDSIAATARQALRGGDSC